MKEYFLKGDANTFYKDNNGSLWLLISDGNILKYDKSSDSFNEFAFMRNNNPFRMTQDNNGVYWIATRGKGIWRFDPESKAE